MTVDPVFQGHGRQIPQTLQTHKTPETARARSCSEENIFRQPAWPLGPRPQWPAGAVATSLISDMASRRYLRSARLHYIVVPDGTGVDVGHLMLPVQLPGTH